MLTTDKSCQKEQQQAIFKEIIKVIRKEDRNLTLQRIVDKAYLEATGKEGEYTCTELYRFYASGYKAKDDASFEENRGLKRTPQKSSFAFVKPYKMATFTSYYLGNDVPTAMFLKGISVSLRLTHIEADELLRAYGYLPFYSKNIFDLSIYSVLMMNTDPFTKRNAHIDPFEIIEERYAAAIRMIEEETQKGDLRDLSDITTEPIHTSQFLRESTDSIYLKDEQKFYAFVKENASYFSIRHGTIIREHEKYIRAIGGLYGGSYDGNASAEDSLEGYSFRSLVEKFVDYKGTHYNRDVIALAQKGDANGFYIPTRELMILLWLYAETFIYDKNVSKWIPCTAKCVKDIKNTFTEEDPRKRRQKYKEFFDNNSFNVREYLFRGYKANVIVWNGEHARQRINEKLSKFGWGMLSNSNKFDLVISKLLSFSINADGRVLYSSDTDRTYPFEFRSIDVPRPLQLIFAVLDEITAQYYRASGECVRKVNLLYSCFERLDSEGKSSMKNKHTEIFNALSDRRYTAFSDGIEYAALDNSKLYAIIDSNCALLNVTLSPDEINASITNASQRKIRAVSAKELVKELMLFPLEANTYEKV